MAGTLLVCAESESKEPSLFLVAVLVAFRVTVFFTGAGGSLGFIAAVFVARVVVAGAGSVGVVAFERVALVAIVVVDGAGFGKREAILCTRLASTNVRLPSRSRRDACRSTRSRSVYPATATSC